MQRGVDVDVKNARLHTPMELATNPETKKLLSKAMKTKYLDDLKNNLYAIPVRKYDCKKYDGSYKPHILAYERI